MVKDPYDLEWMNEKVERLYKNNWLYLFSCFFLGMRKKKLSYQELYAILSRLNEKELGIEDSRKAAFEEVLKVYKYNNNRLPNRYE